MNCLSCKTERGTTFVLGILLCGSCGPVAEKTRLDMVREFDQAKATGMQWLQQHIMKGGLLDPGTDEEAGRTPGSLLLAGGHVPELQGPAPLAVPERGSSRSG